jgi:hypothetical protein
MKVFKIITRVKWTSRLLFITGLIEMIPKQFLLLRYLLDYGPKTKDFKNRLNFFRVLLEEIFRLELCLGPAVDFKAEFIANFNRTRTLYTTSGFRGQD